MQSSSLSFLNGNHSEENQLNGNDGNKSAEGKDIENQREIGTCRLCAQDAVGIDLLLKDNNKIRDIAKMYLAIEFIVGLPTHICYSCSTLLKTWDTFMSVFKQSQLTFKCRLANNRDSQSSTNSTELVLVTPSPAKSQKMSLTPAPPRKRKAEDLSPTTSASSALASPLSSTDKGTIGDGRNSDTDEASECPSEVVEERAVVKKARRGRPPKVMQPIPRIPHPSQNRNPPPQHQFSTPPPPLYQQPPRFVSPGPFARPLLPSPSQQFLPHYSTIMQQQQQAAVAFQQQVAQTALDFQMSVRQPVLDEQSLVLQSYLVNIPPHQHQNFIAHYINNLIFMNTAQNNAASNQIGPLPDHRL
ncbi:bromodomain-containing protein 4-like [Neocloeon triangulifer]|uniref:bromodomain-containing protein 4-like n=1 Tax=Neocloeon triangulifer TaxID=2078957 RepID=UPI00286EED9C|nr:bromodomain-containing protein 4-like [Neocloeon triangulifer]XP_059484834.1 bromodomain-containing protein 4-like [Neocloeon triangulifer]